MVGTVNNHSLPESINKNIFERHPKKTIVLFVIVIFIFIELFGHFIYYFTHQRSFIFSKTDFVAFSPYGWVHYKPNVTVRLPGYPSDLETDQYGFVHNGYKKDIGQDKYLIFLVGGSSAEGRGASSNAATLAACLEKILNGLAGKERFRVVNAGMSGFVTYQQFSLIEGELIPKFQPRMIISLDGHNDGWCAVTFQEWRPNWQPYVDQLTRDVNRNMEPGFGIIIDLIKRHSIIAASFDKIGKKMFRRTDESFTQEEMPPEARFQAAASCYLANEIITRERLKLAGAQYFVFLQPFLAKYLKKKMPPEEAKYVQDWGAEYKNGDVYYLGMEKFYNLVSQQGKNLDFFTDFSKLFLDTPDKTYVDHCHFNDAGNKLIAQAIADKLWPELVNSQ